MASVPLALLGDYHRSSGNQKVSDAIEIKFQKMSQKLPTVGSPAGPPRVQGNNEKKAANIFLF